MVSIALEDSEGTERAETAGGPSLVHVVQVALAIYLMPVIAVVCVIGGVSIVIDRTTRLLSGSGGERASLKKPGRSPASRPVFARVRRRTHVGR